MTLTNRLRMLALVPILVSAIGCASVPMARSDRDEVAKSFATRPDMTNVYIYRTSRLGSALKFPVAIDGKMLGELPGKTFILTTVAPGTHTLFVSAEKQETRSITADAGKNLFVKVSPKMGWASARVDVDVIQDEKKGMSDVVSCKLVQGL